MMNYKNLMFVMIGLFSLSFFQSNAQGVKADDIVGVWLNEDKDAHVEIYNKGGKYFGKIIWLLNPNEDNSTTPNLDDKNQDESLRSRPVMGLQLLTDFVFDGDDEWEDGKIYDPKSGKTYSCYIEFYEGNKDKLKVRGFIGVSLIGKTTYWTRVK
ncbi:MAG TPA: DUF2147 domain-containing protein [Bacteroidales bacterium]